MARRTKTSKQKIPKRGYNASGRRQRALESQARVLDAARRLFAERGYAETTIEAIASDAGVAVPTVYAAFGSKRGVLSRLIGVEVSGDQAAPSVLETEKARAVLTKNDPESALRLFAEHMSEILARVGTTYEVMKNAARADSEMSAYFESALETRFANLDKLTKRIVELGGLREGLEPEDASRTIWVLASPEVRQLLRTHASWTDERYRHWLANTLIAALLPKQPR